MTRRIQWRSNSRRQELCMYRHDRHCSTGTAPQAQLCRHGSAVTALQARLYSHGSYRHGPIQARLHRHGLYRQGSTGTAVQARLCRPGSPRAALKVRLCRHGCTGTPLQAPLYRHTSYRHGSTRLSRHGPTGAALRARLYRHGSTGTALQARLYRHGSTGTCKATDSNRPAQPNQPLSTRRLRGEYAGIGVSGAGPEARQVDLARLHRQGSAGTALQG